jgi:hypothetical protein
MASVSLILLLALLPAVVALFARVAARDRRLGGLRAVLEVLKDGVVDAGQDQVSGSLRGLPVTWRYGSRETSSMPQGWTAVGVGLRRTPPLSLQLRPWTGNTLARGEPDPALCVDVGDPGFAAAFAVEGAPHDVVRVLLAPPLRARLLASHPLELVADPSLVSLAKPGRIEDEAAVRKLIELATAVAEAVPRAFGEADARLEERSSASPAGPAGPAYRPQLDGEAARAARAARAAEVANLEAQRRRRVDARARAARIALGVFLAGIMGVLIVDLLLSR